MYGLHNGYHNFNSFDGVRSLSLILNQSGIRTGIIGKKHVAPESVYPFDYSETEENNSILQVGRNITKMKELAQEFFRSQPLDKSFFLYIGFHDPHRCGHTNPQFGAFCEKFGNGEPGMGIIPDWKPSYYDSSEVVVPQFVQDTPISRSDISAQYTTISRLDQGVGLIMKELEKSGFLDNTLILFTSDNGIPFPNGRTNLYTSGVIEPFIVSSPLDKTKWGTRSSTLISSLDITPTVLDWFQVQYPDYKLFNRPVKLTGASLLADWKSDTAFASHSLHEITMYYPMRSIRVGNLTYIENLNYQTPFPIDQDFFLSPSFQDLLNRTAKKEPLNWIKTLKSYYNRSRYELYNRTSDGSEVHNLAYKEEYFAIKNHMQKRLREWQEATWDPWRCFPSGVLEDAGSYKENPVCLSLNNGL